MAWTRPLGATSSNTFLPASQVQVLRRSIRTAVNAGGGARPTVARSIEATSRDSLAGEGRDGPVVLGLGAVHALTLEYLEAAFYNEASAHGFATGQTKIFLKRVREDENIHVATLKKALGSKAVKEPKFDFGTTTSNAGEFLATSYALENTGVHAYHGQAFNIQSRAYLKVALTIATVEARHAGVVGLLALNSAHATSPDGAFDRGMKAKRILNTVRGTHFIQ